MSCNIILTFLQIHVAYVVETQRPTKPSDFNREHFSYVPQNQNRNQNQNYNDFSERKYYYSNYSMRISS